MIYIFFLCNIHNKSINRLFYYSHFTDVENKSHIVSITCQIKHNKGKTKAWGYLACQIPHSGSASCCICFIYFQGFCTRRKEFRDFPILRSSSTILTVCRCASYPPASASQLELQTCISMSGCCLFNDVGGWI